MKLELLAWIGDVKDRQSYHTAIVALDELETEISRFNKASFLYDNASRSQMLSAAKRLYRLAIEKQKPDAEREPGYQARDLERIKQSLQRIDRRFDAGVEQALWLMFIEQYAQQAKSERVAEFDNFIGLNENFDKDKLAKTLAIFLSKN